MTIPARYTLTEAHFRIAELEAEVQRLTEGLRDSRLLDSLINAVTSHWQEQPGTRGRIVDPDGLRDTLRALLAGSAAAKMPLEPDPAHWKPLSPDAAPVDDPFRLLGDSEPERR